MPKKTLGFIFFLTATVAGCEHNNMNIEYSPNELKIRLDSVNFPEGTESDKLVDYLEGRKISFEIDRSDRSTPCRSLPLQEVKEVIQIYRLLDDSSIIRVAVNADGDILCVSQLGQHRGI